MRNVIIITRLFPHAAPCCSHCQKKSQRSNTREDSPASDYNNVYMYIYTHKNWSLFIFFSYLCFSLSLAHAHTHTHTIFPSANCWDRVFVESRPNGRTTGPRAVFAAATTDKGKIWYTNIRIRVYAGDSYYFAI